MSNHARPVLVKLAVLSLSIVVAGTAGCGGGNPGGGAAEYFPTTIGASWDHAVTPANGIDYTETMQNTAGSPSTLTRTYTTSNGSSFTSSYVLDSSGISLTGGTSLNSQHTYSPPCLILPSNTTPGFSASSTSTYQSSASNYTVTVAVTVDGIETVTVPAGTFSALKVTRLFAEPAVSYNVHWYASGVGWVKAVNEDALQAVQTTWELTSYNIP